MRNSSSILCSQSVGNLDTSNISIQRNSLQNIWHEAQRNLGTWISYLEQHISLFNSTDEHVVDQTAASQSVRNVCMVQSWFYNSLERKIKYIYKFYIFNTIFHLGSRWRITYCRTWPGQFYTLSILYSTILISNLMNDLLFSQKPQLISIKFNPGMDKYLHPL